MLYRTRTRNNRHNYIGPRCQKTNSQQTNGSPLEFAGAPAERQNTSFPSGNRTGWCGPGRASGRIDSERAMLSRDTLSRVVVFAVVVAAVSSPLAAANRDASGAFCDRVAQILDQPVAGLRSFAKMGAVAGLDPILLLSFFRQESW